MQLSKAVTLEQYQSRVAAALSFVLADHHAVDTLQEAMRYSALNGGKRLRAALVYATGELCDAPDEALDAPAAAR